MSNQQGTKTPWVRALTGSLIYPLIGPMGGYVLLVIGWVLMNIVSDGFAVISEWGWDDLEDLLIASLASYAFGGFQALMTGVAVLLQIRWHGRSDLRLNLTVAAVANILPIIIILSEDSINSLIIAILLGTSLGATLLLRPLELRLLRPRRTS